LLLQKTAFFSLTKLENGFHYSVLPDVWKVIFKVAAQLNVQVFLRQPIVGKRLRHFRKPQRESEESALLVRLTRLEGDVIPTFFNKEELATVTQNQIEVR